MEKALETLLLSEGWPQKRLDLVTQVATALSNTGSHLSFTGHCFGFDRKRGTSVGGHGSDAAVGIATLLRSSASVVSVIRTSVMANECYACAALLRQLLEFEYLAYCFANQKKDAADWLRATDSDRRKSWQPRHLRDAAQGHFAKEHYEWHCRIGGHPTPEANAVLNGGDAVQQLLVVDALMHSRRIWEYFLQWAELDAEMAEIWKVSFGSDLELKQFLNDWYNSDPARLWEGW